MTEYKIALVGFGGVNKSFAQLILDDNKKWQALYNFSLKLVGVTDIFLGSVVDEAGIDLPALLALPTASGALAGLPGGAPEADNERVILGAGADIIAEATFTNPTDGEPAAGFCRLALAAGKHVVTTNKGPVALHAAELNRLAQQHGVCFEYEGAVMSGTPVLRLAKQTMAGNAVTGFEGILNGTSNYVLTRMEEGLSFQSAIAEAQHRGYAEADPSADIGGGDVRLKVAILANELLGAALTVQDVSCEGINRITVADIISAHKKNCRWKLVGAAYRDASGQVKASVAPRMLLAAHPLAAVSGATNAISFSTELLETVTISGPGAGRKETAFALLSDIISIHQRRAAQ